MFKLFENDTLIWQSTQQYVVLEKLQAIVIEARNDGCEVQRIGSEEDTGLYIIDGRLYSIKVD